MKYDDRFFKYVRNFLTVYLPMNRCCSENTVKAYRDTLNLLRIYMSEKEVTSFTKITFELLNCRTIGNFLDWLESERDCSVTTRNHRLAALKSFFKYAAQEDPSLMINYMDLSRVTVKKHLIGQLLTYRKKHCLYYLHNPMIHAVVSVTGSS